MPHPSPRRERLHFAASARPEAQQALVDLRTLYGDAGPDDPDVVVALGGDGFMLEQLHAFMGRDVPIYGMNRGSVGFLMNDFAPRGLLERVARAEPSVIHPLSLRAEDVRGRLCDALAINEVSLLRQTRQTAKIQISVDGRTRMDELIADGVMVSTPAGSTAYNLSAHGPILPIDAQLLALTPISAFRPRRWRGALLPHGAQVRFDVIEPQHRPVSATADSQEFRDIAYAEVEETQDVALTMLFDEGRALSERILTEQFTN